MNASIRDLITAHLDALALRDDDTVLSRWWSAPALAPALVLTLHLAGLAAFWRYYHQALWLALPTLVLVLALPLAALRKRRRLAVETLAPLFFLYAVLLARVIAVRVLLANEPYADEASFADPRFIFFQIEAAAFAALGYTAVVQVVRLTREPARTRLLVALAGMLLSAGLGWFALETIGHRTRGVTATDPYAYAQMAVDLATGGTPLHHYPLFPYVANLNVSWYPIEHIGYRLFDNLTGSVPTVWPVGGSVWLALAYRLGGEDGLGLATPFAALASLLALGWLAWEYFREQPVVVRAAIAAIAVTLLATSWEQVDRSIVPLVDAQAQLFTTLAVVGALAGTRRYAVQDSKPKECNIEGAKRPRFLASLETRAPPARAGVTSPLLSTAFWPLLTGLALGAAYAIRHTQVLIAVALVLAVWRLPWRERVRFLALAAAGALVVALPDLWYHRQYLGGWFVPESNEMTLFGVSSILPSTRALAERFFAGNEFGYLIPFLLYGIYRAAREDGHRFAVLAAWVGILGGFHLLYQAVKIRDLLPEYPAVMVWTGYGMVALARDIRRWGDGRWATARSGMATVAVGVAILLAFLLPAMRDRLTILRPFQPAKVTFGYVTAAQRASFDRIAALTPPDAIIGSTMNDGAIDLYSRRATFRPGAWSTDECVRFIEVMQGEQRPVYVLDDGAETSAARRALASRYTLRRVAVLDVPLFGVVDETPGTLWEIVVQ